MSTTASITEPIADPRDPLVPTEVDLRDFPFMPLTIAQLKQSKQWLRCKRRPELAFYSINLWMSAWHERPAGSLEDDDDVLADRAMCPPEKWDKIRGEVLRNWVKCADGRLYHPVVAEKALEAWNGKVAHRNRMDEARRAKEEKRKQRLAEQAQSEGQSTTRTTAGPVTERGTAAKPSAIGPVTGLKGEGQGKGQGQREGQGDSKNGGGGSARARDEADLVVDHFEAERHRLWPTESALPAPKATLRTEVNRYLEGGATADLLCELLTRFMTQQAEGGRGAPGSLKAYQRSLPDAITLHRNAAAADPFGIAANGNGAARGPSGFKSKAQIAAEQEEVLARRAREEEALLAKAAEEGRQP